MTRPASNPASGVNCLGIISNSDFTDGRAAPWSRRGACLATAGAPTPARGPRAQAVEVALQMRGRRVGSQIVVVDAGRHEFIDGKGHTSHLRFAPIIADRLRQVVGGG